MINERAENRALLSAHDCATRTRYADWPTYDPNLGSMREGDARTAALVRRLGNRTLVLAGDSSSGLDFRGIRCAVQREQLEDSARTRAALETWRAWGKRHRVTCCKLALGTARGGAVVYLGACRYDANLVGLLLEAADVLLMNYGLHYAHKPLGSYERDMRALFRELDGGGATALVRETTAQHFPGTGSYTPGAERASARCACAAHSRSAAREKRVLLANRVLANASQQLSRGRVPIVPAYALSAPRHDMHSRTTCAAAPHGSGSRARGRGACAATARTCASRRSCTSRTRSASRTRSRAPTNRRDDA